MEDLYLGIDIGSASTKAALTTADGQIVTTATREHTMDMPRPGWAEVEPEQLWWAEIRSICQELTKSLTGAEQIKSVCVSGVGPCLALCTDDLTPVRPAILYGIDMRATQEIDDLTARYGAGAIFERCGKALSTQAVGPKMLWVQRHETANWDGATRWFSSSSYVVAKLTGEYVLDHHTASQCDPLYDIGSGDWSEWADDVAAGLSMPRLAWPGEVAGTVSETAAKMTGLAPGTPVCAGTIDAWAEAFSAGVRKPGDLMLMYGSTMFFVQVLHDLHAHPKLWTTAGVEPGQYTLAAGMATSGLVTDWLRNLFGTLSFDELASEAAAAPPGSDGLLVLPYFAGERTPIFDPDARGVIAGLTLRHGPGHLFRASYEGIAFGIRQILELIADVETPQRLVAVGGGTQSGLWPQVVSDICDRPQLIPETTIGACYGNALLAAIGIGAVAADTDWTRPGNIVQPNPTHREVYDEFYESYCELYPATMGHMHFLAGRQQTEEATRI